MTALAIGGQIAGSVLGALGAQQSAGANASAALFQGQVDAANFEAQADAYKFNARVAEQQAKNTRLVAQAESHDFKIAGNAKLAARRAVVGASGVVATSGSPLLVDNKIVENIEFGSKRIINAGEIVRTRQLNEASLLRGQAANAKQNAKYAKQGARMTASAYQSAGAWSAASSLANGVAGVGSTLASAGTFG